MKMNRRGALCALLLALVCACDPKDAPTDPGGPVIQTGKVAGTTRTEDGQTLSGVLVKAEGTDASATTDAQGTFTLYGLKPGAHSIVASRKDYLPATQAVEVKADETATVALVLAVSEGRVAGTVQLDDATSHEGITVTLDDSGLSTTTDASGAFALENVRRGAWRLVASKADYLARYEVITVRGDETTSMALKLARATSRITGTVRFDDAASHQGITVSLQGTKVSTTTDASGAFVLENVKTGTWRIVASQADYVAREAEVEVHADAAATVALTLTRAAGRVEGKVLLDGASSHEGITVSIVGTDASTTTDASGAFVLGYVKTGLWVLQATKENYLPRAQEVTVLAGLPATVSFTLMQQVGRVTGTVRMADNSSLEGVLISATGTTETTVTDAQGVYTLFAVPAGARTVTARKSHYTQGTQAVTVVRDESRRADFELARVDGPPAVTFPMLSVQGGALVLKGGPFGFVRGASSVTVGGVTVTEYSTWTEELIVAQVPASLASGEQPVVVTMAAPWRPAVSGSVRVLRAQTVSAANDWGVAVRTDGTVAAWGSTPSGLGDLKGVVSVGAVWLQGVALLKDGSVASWGSRNEGRPDVHDGVAVAAAGLTRFVLRADGTLMMWGASVYGEDSPPAGLKDVVGIHGGFSHVVAVTKDGRAVAWGQGSYDATKVPANLTNVVAVAPAGFHNVALRQDGTVAAWGSNVYGEGNVPGGLKNVVSVAAGQFHSYALQKDGTVSCWGNNDGGRCNVPAGLTGVAEVINIGDGAGSIALKQDGTLVSWGTTYGFSRPPGGLVVVVPPR
ncbi:carboxypeptidase regulatory-like domain-containing protein [Corallococcus exiguus]|uniref:carboxypeptidase regulatory-like domain-containing protein n=1 Tax=Corallococcus exiguus TaxID=83462 RepID=UPI001493EABA|nr:carboxypeptidase regulatory-like domain-containing protein [Corallococcus exiguus]NPD28020.1 hypothetical protein [Corallococcus exiguus]NRD49727.1 carboxypeptidase regulatory-like domain-containing protein [Corallococcus exiguus]